jgi:hypothetical protein
MFFKEIERGLRRWVGSNLRVRDKVRVVVTRLRHGRKKAGREAVKRALLNRWRERDWARRRR